MHTPSNIIRVLNSQMPEVVKIAALEGLKRSSQPAMRLPGISIRFRNTELSEDEDYRYTRYFLEFDEPTDEKDVEAFALDMWPRTHCQHEYDCCGNWYGGLSDIKPWYGDRGWMIATRYSLNI